jgi:hypothetical protein
MPKEKITMAKKDKDLNKKLEKILKYFTEIQKNVRSMSKIIVDVIDNHDNGRERLLEVSMFSSYELTVFERIGRGLVDVRLSPVSEIGSAHLLRKLPLSEQKRALKGKLKLVQKETDKVVYREWRTLTPTQCKQAVSAYGIRTVEEQRTYIENLKKHPKPPQPEPPMEAPVTVIDGKIKFSSGKLWDPVDVIDYATKVMRDRLAAEGKAS